MRRRRRERRHRKREGANIKEEARRGKRNAMDHPRERSRTGWEPAAHAVPLGGSLILFAYPGPSGTGEICSRTDLSLPRALRRIIIGRRLYSYVKSTPNTRTLEKQGRSLRDEIIQVEASEHSNTYIFLGINVYLIYMETEVLPSVSKWQKKSQNATCRF